MLGSTKFSQRFTWGVLAVSLLALPTFATGATYYVDTAGNDANDGLTPATAWKTITNAAATVPAGLSPASPNVIMVAAGTYDNTTNGETFPINFANNHISLTGAGAGTTTIDAEALGDALDVDGWYFSISGFTFSNATDALDISGGGFTVTDNIFDSTVGDGVHHYVSTTDLNTSLTVGDMTITGNTFQTTSDGVYINAHLDFDFLTENLTVTVGDLTISNNSFPVTGGSAIDADGEIHVTDLLNGTVTLGNFTVTNNTFTDASYGTDIYYYIDYMEGCQITVGDTTITGNTYRDGSTGVYFYGGLYELDDCQVTVGDLLINNNTFSNQSSDGVYVDYWDVEYIYGDSVIALGEFNIAGNEITSNTCCSDAIDISDVGYIEYIYDDSTVSTGPINITDNMIYVDEYGIYMYFAYVEYLGEEYFDDPVQVTLGPTNITGNTITSRDYYGAYIEYYDIGYEMYGQSSVVQGPFTFANNTVNSDDEALYFYVDYWGEYLYEDSSVLINPVTITNNILNSSDDDGLYLYVYDTGYYLYDNSSVTVKEFDISNNSVSGAGGNGMLIIFTYNGYYMYDSSTLTMSPVTIDNNTVFGGSTHSLNISNVDNGSYMEGSSSAILPDWIITNNTLDAQNDKRGIFFKNNDYAYYNGEYSQVSFGDTLIDSNIINQNGDAGIYDGIFVLQSDTGDEVYGRSVVTTGDFTITNNQIYNADYYGIRFSLHYFADDLYDRPTLTHGDVEIGDNIIDRAGDTGIYIEMGNNETDEGASVTMGGFNIHDNTLTDIADTGIYFYNYNYNSNPDDASLTVGAPVIANNTISSLPGFDDGIYFYVYNDSDGVTMGTPVFTGNMVSGFDNGIYVEMDDQDTATLSCNYLENNNDIGLYFETDATGLTVNNNSFVDNFTWGLSVDDGYTAVVDAEDNWWGDKLGPAACASCNGVNPGTMGTVDYDPWSLNRTAPFRCGQPFPWILFTPATTAMSPAVP